jgi:hypothetical protein
MSSEATQNLSTRGFTWSLIFMAYVGGEFILLELGTVKLF